MPQNKLKTDEQLGDDNLLPGFPGYRTRQGRSGLDPLDTNREAAFMEGVFLRNLFAFRLRTRNPFHLVLMVIFGAVTTVFMSFFFYALLSSPLNGERNLAFYLTISFNFLLLGFILLIGLALLVNFMINIAVILGFGESRQELKSKKVPEKKLPKRRKDYR